MNEFMSHLEITGAGKLQQHLSQSGECGMVPEANLLISAVRNCI
jgi:hypothetical protein